MRSLGKFCDVANEFADVADFLVVYVKEVHPIGAWQGGNKVEIATHKNINDRFIAAKCLEPFAKDTFSLVVDVFNDDATRAYGGFPEKLYIIHDNKMAYCGKIGPFLYKVSDIEDWLRDFTGQK